MPNKRGLKPSYSQKSFEERLNKEKMVLVVSPDQEGDSIGIAQDAKLYVSRLKKDVTHEYVLSEGRAAWLQVIKGSISVNDVEITAGDGLAVIDEKALRFKSLHDAEFMLFDLKS
jgi:redox-sensitive bicupin YhaK (pirin superfamily)